MYCQNCGNPIEDDAKFCPACGAKVQAEEQPKEEPKPVETPTASYSTSYENSRQEPTSDEGRTLAIVGLVLAFIFPLIGLILSIVAYNKQKNIEGASSKGIAKAGIIVAAVLMALNLIYTIVLIPTILAMVAEIVGSAL